MTPEEFLQQWAYESLAGKITGIISVTGAVEILDHVPAERAYPYVAIGEDTISEDDQMGDDDSRLFSLTLHVWSRYPGKKQAKQIGGQVVTFLRAALTHTGEWRVERVNLDLANYYLDPDGFTQHGVVRIEGALGHYPI